MKSLSLLLLLSFVLTVVWLGQSEANFCPCNLNEKVQICGSNGITYTNRCEFECTQREYKGLGRKLSIRKMGPC
ncbi:hypothetical protein AWZ03_008817 [Drosophila navojoa]|uniref:Kazal-like domain-containing protein n=1 Tax=Drosophila navojoa TaxID=7232 RepID=A0A484BAC1_DRONA|nr:agrin-like [Drosophila navojoa]TDG44761.1 hypothetical protein AWZ03_008817 [Drosophila navojoa]